MGVRSSGQEVEPGFFMRRTFLAGGIKGPSERLAFAWFGMGDFVQDPIDVSADVYQIGVSKLCQRIRKKLLTEW